MSEGDVKPQPVVVEAQNVGKYAGKHNNRLSC
jgi:hypothetical protein